MKKKYIVISGAYCWCQCLLLWLALQKIFLLCLKEGYL